MRYSFAPNALNTTRRSIDIDSGIVKISSYPLAAATMANAMPVTDHTYCCNISQQQSSAINRLAQPCIPVFPEVGSTSTVLPGVMRPFFSASRIMLLPMRSTNYEDRRFLNHATFTCIYTITLATTHLSRCCRAPCSRVSIKCAHSRHQPVC